MPSALRKLLQTDGTPIYEKIIVPGQAHIMKINKRIPNWSKGIIPVLQQLIEQDPDTAYAYTCSPAVTHISKLKNEGSFCGYRNIQMLTSFVIADKFRGHEVFEGKVPTIFDIQDTIEDAWDVGIHSYNRISTGGIKGTRRYIGTPEVRVQKRQIPSQTTNDRQAQAFFEYLNIP